MSLIRLQALGKAFHGQHGQTTVLDSVDLQIEPGRFVTISGPSGSGKSTLMSILALLDSPTRGSYLLDGIDTRTLDFDTRATVRNQHIGIVFQAFHLLGDLDVYENVRLPLRYHRGIPPSEHEERVRRSIEQVGLADRMHHRPAQLSGGQQQRVAIARALVCGPSILLADEPTGNLDSGNSRGVLELFQHLHRNGMTLCLVTHNPEIWAMGQDRYHMLDGRLEPA